MTRRIVLGVAAAVILAASWPPAAFGQAGKRRTFHKLPFLENGKFSDILWGAQCEGDGFVLGFGGENTRNDDGIGHTRIKVDGQWKVITDELRKANPLNRLHQEIRQNPVNRQLARMRFLFFEGLPKEQLAKELAEPGMADIRQKVTVEKAENAHKNPKLTAGLDAAGKEQLRLAGALVAEAGRKLRAWPTKDITPEDLKSAWQAKVLLDRAAEFLDAEPPARVFSPIAYDAKSKLFVIFGGDHGDYLTNDTWVFEPARKQWRQRHPKAAPPPRADHKLTAAGDGKIKLAGGYNYANNLDYMGGQYLDIDDGEWTYDVAADTWTSDAGGQGVAPDQRVYRTGPFLPEHFMQGERPDAAAWGKKFDALPANTWVETKPPYRPQMQRDWGTAVIDTDRDVMLRWSGGHCAHGGSDVPMYHFATNRWELPFPVELPFGHCYTNTIYPDGFNLNRRPWMTGHSYRSYEYDSPSKLMVMVGHVKNFFLWDTAVADWVGKGLKPAGMVYTHPFYDLFCRRTPRGVVCWTRNGQLFRFDGQARKWDELKVTGEKLLGNAVDASGFEYDAKRDRALLFPSAYATPFKGQVIAVDLKESKAVKLNPAGMAGMNGKVKFMRETCYSPEADMVICGATIPSADGKTHTTPALDCAANKWIGLELPGPNPAGPTGQNVSLGLMYDAKRKALWAVDTVGNVYVLKLDPKTLARKNL